MLLQAGLIALLALASLVALVVGVAVRRLTHMRWQPASSSPVPRDDVPPAIRAQLERPAAELAQLGFVYRSSGRVTKMLVTPADEPVFYDLYQHRDGHTHALVSPSPVPERNQPCLLQLITCLDDGNNWTTLNRSHHFAPVDLPRWQAVDDYLPQWSQAWQRHQQRVQSATAPICTDAAEAERRLQQSFADLLPHLQQQGSLVPAADGHSANSGHFRLTLWAAIGMAVRVLRGQLRAGWNAPKASAPDAPTAVHQPQNLDADLHAFQNQLAVSRAATTSTSKSKWTTFVVTALLFLLVGGLWFSWTLVPIVLAVVALHEGGHYLAMRLTGFRNVSVFFVPGLGGLATGEKAFATPLEKVFVYLAGPLPGIVLAGAAFWASASGLWTGPGWLREFLIASVVINYLNLLPLVPLDGGRVLEMLVFARHPRLRFGFAALGSAALFGLGLLLDDMVLRVVAVLLALGLPYQWRRMLLDQAVPRDNNAALDEPDALERIFGALQQARFQGWSFAKRTAAATALLPDLLARRASHTEAAIGTLVYAACLLGPIGAAFVAMPHLGTVVSALAPAFRTPPDDVDPEPPRAPMAEPVDWQARLAQGAKLPADQMLEAHTGAGQQASDANDVDTALRHFEAAWALASALPPRDLRRIDVLQGLASEAPDDAQQRTHLLRIVSELAEPTGAERERVAQAKEQLAYGDGVSPADRVALLREALDLRVGTATPDTHFAVASTRLLLAQALDANADSTGAQAQLQARLDGLPLPNDKDRSRHALDRRVQRLLATVDLAWFLTAHGQAATAEQTIRQALADVPATVTVSWLHPRQQALDAQVWALLLSRQTTALAQPWEAYDAAVRGGLGGDRKLLYHEVDRMLVAQALNDARMQARAQQGVTEALASMSKQGTALCRPPHSGPIANWHAPQQTARRQVLTRMGLCPAA